MVRVILTCCLCDYKQGPSRSDTLKAIVQFIERDLTP